MKKFLSIFILLFSVNSFGKFLVNPYVGRSSGKALESNRHSDIEAYHFGAQLGYQGEYFMSGLDVSYHYLDVESGFLGSTKDSYKEWDWGLFCGVGFNKMRLWAGLSLNALEKEAGIDGQFFGQAYRLGIGFKVLGDVFVNIETIKNDYFEEEINNGPTNKLANKVRTKVLLISFSVPTYF